MLELLYDERQPLLKVTKRAGTYLESMGVPARADVFMQSEEAIYLLQTGGARILTINGQELFLPQAFVILQRSGVSMYKYSTYCELKSTGLVVLRPRPNRLRVPHLLRMFKAFSNSEEPSCSGAPPVSTPPHDSFAELGLSETRVLCSPGVWKDFQTTSALRNLLTPTTNKKNDRPCRPRFWPTIWPGANQVQSWKQFDAIQRQAISAVKLRSFRVDPRTQSQRRFETSTTTSEDVDFHVFSPRGFSHNLPARPLFGVVCFDARSQIRMDRLARMSNVVLAIYEDGKVNFVATSGQPIDITRIL
ncbi:unnamed protein product [Caenorhabditis auriculariae]|uniref:tRNA-splicing endonuclease subunit Sen54 N-terminal domain-containing protein n=1 Tax=Caenorhabditis auriculariae TaxID=2777116 RepID=A0A8S1HV10_9PELO|nr:unnamed protein product [Caenorhabditis auriculariae]